MRCLLAGRPLFRDENAQTDDRKQTSLKCGSFRYGIRFPYRDSFPVSGFVCSDSDASITNASVAMEPSGVSKVDSISLHNGG